jgi:hypothetical protein
MWRFSLWRFLIYLSIHIGSALTLQDSRTDRFGVLKFPNKVGWKELSLYSKYFLALPFPRAVPSVQHFLRFLEMPISWTRIQELLPNPTKFTVMVMVMVVNVILCFP